MQRSLLCKYFTKSHQSKFKFSHICVAQKVCKHYVKLLCRKTASKGRKGMRLEVVKEKNPNFLYLCGRGALECTLLNLKIFCFNCVLDLLENLENH